MRIPAFLLVGTLFSTATFAGAYLESAGSAGSGEQKMSQATRMWFDGGRMRTESGGKGEGSIAIYKNNAMYVLDPASKSYRVLDKATLEKLAGQLAEARKKMQSSLAGLPPEQRAKMEKLMGGGDSSKRVLKNTGRTETVAGFKCTVWEASEDGKKEEEICAAAPGSVPGGEDMMQTMRSVGEMLKGFTQNVGGGAAENTWRDLETIKGMPIMMRTFDGATVASENKLTLARKESVPAAQFEVPAGYTEKKMPVIPGGAQQ